MKPAKFKLWVIKNQKIKFPDNWNKAKILKWCNEEAIRMAQYAINWMYLMTISMNVIQRNKLSYVLIEKWQDGKF